MDELNCVFVFNDGAGNTIIYYPYTKFRNILDAPDINGMESTLGNHVGNTDVHVTPERMANIDSAISGLIAHTENGTIHVTAADKAAWSAAATDAANALAAALAAQNKADGLESRVARVEDGLFNDITGNPFLVSFDSLDGIALTSGVWNTERQRIEC